MNLSLKRRVAACFIVATMVIMVISLVVFYFLSSLNKDMDNLMDQSNQITQLTDEVRISAVSILKHQRKFLSNQNKQEIVERIIELCDGLLSQLQSLTTMYSDPEVKDVIDKMSIHVNSLKVVLSKATFYRSNTGFGALAELSDNILEAFSEFQNFQYHQAENRDSKMNEIINETKKKMMMTIIIGFLGSIVLALIIPGKIALPFKKINDAIRELQDCNFDVSIYYNQDDEIGEMASEMNKMIASIKKFEELRAEKISVEHRKFDVLANLVKKPVLISNANSKLIYMNNILYERMNVQSDDILNKDIKDTSLPRSIVDAFELAINRRSKIENVEIIFPSKSLELDEDEDETNDNLQVANNDARVIENEEVSEKKEDGVESESVDKKADEKTAIHKGYANIIPIRGKDSSLDYYLMVISAKVAGQS